MQRDMTCALDATFATRNAGRLVGVVPARPQMIRMHGVDVIDASYRARQMHGPELTPMPGPAARRIPVSSEAEMMAKPGFPRLPGLRGLAGFDMKTVAMLGAGAFAAYLLYKHSTAKA